jgi:hypothetical protein
MLVLKWHLFIPAGVSGADKSLMRRSDSNEDDLLNSGGSLLYGHTPHARNQVLQRHAFVVINLRKNRSTFKLSSYPDVFTLNY